MYETDQRKKLNTLGDSLNHFQFFEIKSRSHKKVNSISYSGIQLKDVA